MVFIAEWVLNAYRVPEDSSKDRYARLEQKVYSLAGAMKCEDLIEYDEDLKEYFPAGELQDGPVMERVEEYNNETFWDELIDRLVLRDLVRRYGTEKLVKMSLEERWEADEPVRRKYAAEFERSGIEKLEVMTFL